MGEQALQIGIDKRWGRVGNDRSTLSCLWIHAVKNSNQGMRRAAVKLPAELPLDRHT